MKIILFVILSFFSLSLMASEVIWDKEASYKIDIDCDGVKEDVFVGHIDNDFIIKLMPSSSNKTSQLQFGLAQPTRQDAICGKKIEFSTYKSDSETQMILFDQIFEGYKSDNMCFDLNISGGECDSITVYYNHKTQELNWWRL